MNLSDLLPVRVLKRFDFLSRTAWLFLGLPAALAADTLVSTTTFSYAGQTAQTYTVPAGANYVVIKAWGAGGGGANAIYPSYGTQGGNAGFVSTVFCASPGDRFTIAVASGGAGYNGGGANCAGGLPGGGSGTGNTYSTTGVFASGGGGGGCTRVQTPYGSIWAAGGGGGGFPGVSYNGGDGGAPNATTSVGMGGTTTGGGAGAGNSPYWIGSPGSLGQGGNAYAGMLNDNRCGGGGGGGGYYGGGGGGPILGNGIAGMVNGGGGASFVSGMAYNTVYQVGATSDPNYPGGNVGRGGSSSINWNGGNGAVVILAYQGTSGMIPGTLAAGSLPSQTFIGNSSNPTYTYTVPANTGYVIVKAWGAGGGSHMSGTGGAGAYVTASYGVTPGQTITIQPGSGGVSAYGNWCLAVAGGRASVVTLPNGGKLYAAGGGGGGFSYPGGVGGAPNGQAGGGTTTGGGGGTTYVSGGTTYGSGGTCGYGNLCNGFSGGTNSADDGGAGGVTESYYSGGGGGGGLGGGGGGGCDDNVGNGGGGGGSSAVINNASVPVASLMQAGSGFTAPNVTDPFYPGSGVGGGSNAWWVASGGPGAVVILAFTAPAITNTLTQCFQPNQAVDYWITAQYFPGSFSATGLPPGLTLNSSTGEITGTPTTPGTYNSTINATNGSGTTSATLVWNIDNISPSAPGGLQSGNLACTSFTLSWSASTDTSGIAAYEVRRDGISQGTVTGTSAYVAGLAPSTMYAMTVRACDAAGNWSDWSAPLSVTTAADITAPSVPTGLVTSNLSATFLTLNWTPATDNVGVTVYRIQQNGTTLPTTTEGTAMTITGLSAQASYSFAVQAGDAAGNWSAWSTPVLSVTTPAAGADILLGTSVFTYSGKNAQTYPVPVGANYVVIKAWGAGGGTTTKPSWWTNPLGYGGNGGYAAATLNVSSGDAFSITVGTGGIANNGGLMQEKGQGGWLGGGGANYCGGGGGGYSRIQTPYGSIWAGGGGGGSMSGNSGSPYGSGGGGGGASGWSSMGYGAGTGGSSSAGGTAGTYGGYCYGTNGSLGQGGSGADCGSGGGGGYYGGGGGFGGGGGSSYVTGPAYNILYRAGSTVPGGLTDPNYPGNNVGYGGLVSNIGPNGGSGAVVIMAYQTPGANLTQTFVPTGGNQTYTVPAGADYVVVKAWGAGAGNTGAGGGYVTATYTVSGNQTITVNAGAGGVGSSAGGSSVVTLPGNTIITVAGGGSGVTSNIAVGSPSPTSSQILAPSGSTPPSTSDTNYPGNNVGYGGPSGGNGGDGAVVIITHILPPVITSSLTQSMLQFATVNYTIAATNGATVFAASNLPAGLTLNPATGVITGSIASPGTYSSTISATNRAGMTQATLVWNIAADTVPPSVPTGLQVNNITFNSLVLSWSASTDNIGVATYEVRSDPGSQGTVAGTSYTVSGLQPITTYALSVRACDTVGNWSDWSTPVSITTLNPGGDTLLGTTTFGYTGHGTQSYTVPAGANYVVITAKGGGGGGCVNPIWTGWGAVGDSMSVTYNVSSGDTFTITVGGGGLNNTHGGTGGWPGGGNGESGNIGGGGGGFSKIQTPYGTAWAGGGGGGSTYGFGGTGPSGGNGYGGGDASGGGGGSLSAGGLGGILSGNEIGGRGSYEQGGSGSGGGGGGYYGGGGGAAYYDESYAPIYNLGSGGGGGSSNASGSSYNKTPIYSGSSVDQSNGDGANGSVTVRAYKTPGNSPTQTFLPGSGSQTYTVPANTDHVVIKAWGAGGASLQGSTASGGAGAFVSATYNVTAGQTIVVNPGAATSNYGGQASLIALPGGTTLYAAGGGASGLAPNGCGGAGGAANGQAGGGGYGSLSAGGGGVTYNSGTSAAYGVGGVGGYGDSLDSDGNPNGYGSAGGSSGISDGGPGGAGYSESYPYRGGGGGGGLGGGGGGGGGDINGGGGGGGGGSSGIMTGTQSPTSSLILAGSGSTPPNLTDVNYPGNNVAFGGVNGCGKGGGGAVVIIAYSPTPVITSSLTQSPVQNQAVTYTITATNNPTSFAASGMPTGLSLNPTTGIISGSVAAVGSYSTTISATNSTGTGQATLVWNVVADTVAPTVPTGLHTDSVTAGSFVLAWTAATDNAAVTGYEVRRDSASLGMIASTGVTISGLLPGTTYAMTVRACDAVGNCSDWSTACNVTTLASGQSGAPVLNYADCTATTVTLVWAPVTNGMSVAGYNIYRNGALLRATGELVYTDTGLAAGTSYSYVVKAFDAAGTESPASIAVAVTTTQDFTLDTDHDGVPDSAENVLFPGGHSSVTTDTANQLQLNIQRPSR